MAIHLCSINSAIFEIESIMQFFAVTTNFIVEFN